MIHNFILFMRWIATLIILPILLVFVLFSIPLAGLSISLTNRDMVKNWVEYSGVYENAVDLAAIMLSQQPSEEDSELAEGKGNYFSLLAENINNKESDIGILIRKLASPEKLKRDATTILDAFYDWLEGKTQEPAFVIPIVEDKEILFQLFSIALQEKIKGLPDCPLGYNMPVQSPFELECRPADFDPNIITQFFESNQDHPQINTLLENTKISSDMIHISPEKTESIQLAYRYVRLFPLLAFGAIILLSLVFLTLTVSESRFYITGSVLTAPAITLFVGALIAKFGFESALIEFILLKIPQSYSAPFQTYGMRFVHAMYQDVTTYIAGTSLVVLFLGSIYIVIGKYISNRKPDVRLFTKQSDDTPSISDSKNIA